MGSETEIMEATQKALEKNGYSDLSIQKIADEFPKSKSLLYHHYDSKDEILLEFMDQTLENFTESCLETGESSEQQLMNKAFIGFNKDKEITKAMVEIRTEGIRDERYRKRFEKFSKQYREMIKELISEHCPDGSIDPEKVAMFVGTANKEAMFLRAEERNTENLREELESYLKQKIPV
jgi:AcrR family transcriptional regulator